MALCLGVGGESFAAKSKYRRSKFTSDETHMSADRRTVLLTTGEDRVVDIDFKPNADRGIMIGNPKIVATTLVTQGDEAQILFKPLSAGETNVSIRDDEGNLKIIFVVRVVGTALERTAAQLGDLLKEVEGIQIKIVGKKVVIDGEVLVPSDYSRIFSVISDKVYGEQVLNLATLSPYAMQLLSKRIQLDVGSFAPNVKTRVVNGQIWLEGTVDNFDQARRAQLVAQLYLPELRPGDPLEGHPSVQRLPPRGLVQNFIVINPPPPKKEEKLVRVTIHFVELAKDYQRIFGFKWQPGFTSDPQVSVNSTTGSNAADATSFTATLSSLFPKLQSAQVAGYARVLKSGTVVVRSGQPAKLTEKTVIPFAMVGPNGQVVTSQAGVGLQMGVTPAILGTSDDIQMDLKMEQVNLTGRAGNTPITAEHSVETKVYVKSGESAALAGVSSNDVKTDFNKDDADQGNFQQGSGSQTKALFNLNRSKNYNKKKTQFVIFVTPQIINNASEGTQDLKKNFRIKAEMSQ